MSVDVHVADIVPLNQAFGSRHAMPGVVVEVKHHESGTRRMAPRGVIAIDGYREPLKGSEQVVWIGLTPSDLHAAPPYGLGGEQ